MGKAWKMVIFTQAFERAAAAADAMTAAKSLLQALASLSLSERLNHRIKTLV